MLNAVGNCQQVCKHHLSYTLGAVGRHVGNNDAALVSLLNVYHVVASSQYADIFQLWQLGHYLSADNHFVRKNNFCIGSSCHRLLGLGAVVNHKLAQFLKLAPGQIAWISCKSV